MTERSAYISSNRDHASQQSAFAALTFLFFAWGLLTSLNDVLVPHFKAAFQLSYAQAALIQFCYFGAYFVVSWPSGVLLRRIGYRQGIVLGLIVAAFGCWLFYPAARGASYAWFLIALFVLASGIALLQVAANPCVTQLSGTQMGAAQTAASRLNFAQGFNALGTTIGPLIGAAFILSFAGADAADAAHAAYKPYLAFATILGLAACGFAFLQLPAMTASATHGDLALWRQQPLASGVVAIFLYVGGEVTIGSFLISFLEQPNVAGLSPQAAARYLALYWGGAMIGRFIGSAVMRYIPAATLLAFNAACAVVLLSMAMTLESLAMWAVIAVGLCNSIMFPTIFALALNGLGSRSGEGAGLLCMAIVGGALVPVAQGFAADRFGLTASFFVPLICYLYVGRYGLKLRRAGL